MSREITSRKLNTAGSRRSRKFARSDASQGPLVTSLRMHSICVVMALLSAAIFTVTEHDDHRHTLWCILEIAVQTLIVVGATCYFRRRIAVLHESPVIMPMLIMAASLSLVCEPVQRTLMGTGNPFEILIMHCSCNLMLALAVCGFRMSFQRLAALNAVFMTIFCCTISNAPGLIPLVILFAISAIVWLVAAWWETVDRRILDGEQTGMPLRWLAIGGALPMLILVAGDGFGANSVTTALRGFMPSSGGTGEYSPHSRGGVNDGDALVAGDKNIKSFAPLEDAPFVDSEKPTLYDVFSDTFEEPASKKPRTERAISLPADLLKHVHQLMAEARQAGREFSLLRSQRTSNDKRLRDLKSQAIFYLAGRTPLHLRMQVYELFDGTSWLAVPPKPATQPARIAQTDDRDWLRLPRFGSSLEVFSGTATHSIKVANIDGNTLPVPAQAIGVSIDKVDRADMYRVDANGLISLSRKSVPPLTAVNVMSQCVAWETLGSNPHISIIRRTQATSLESIDCVLPDGHDMDNIRRLAEQWTGGSPRGWRQVEAITKRLKRDYLLDRSSHASSEAESPVHEFLFETRRGPEYQFASAAAVMLRSLGYSSRVVGGFYARPDKYDAHKRHTVVDASDAHFWCEVFVGASTWLTVEPSPGYDLLTPPPGLLARLKAMLLTVWNHVVQHFVLVLTTVVLLIAAFVTRRMIQNVLLTLRWKLTGWRSPRNKAVSLAILIDHRLRLTGLERSSGTTLNRWARQQVLEPVRGPLTRVAEIADRAVFAHDETVGQVVTDELNQLASHLSYRRLSSLQKPTLEQTT